MILVQRSLCNRSIRNESMRADLCKPHIAFTNAFTASRDVRALDIHDLCSPDINFSRARSDGGDLRGQGAEHRLGSSYVNHSGTIGSHTNVC